MLVLQTAVRIEHHWEQPNGEEITVFELTAELALPVTPAPMADQVTILHRNAGDIITLV